MKASLDRVNSELIGTSDVLTNLSQNSRRHARTKVVASSKYRIFYLRITNTTGFHPHKSKSFIGIRPVHENGCHKKLHEGTSQSAILK